MRIRTQYIITIAAFSVLLIVIGALTVVESEQISRTRAQILLADNVAKGASDLSYLSSDYVVYRGNQQLSQWQTRYASFSSDANKLTADTLEQQTIIQNIQANQQRIKTVFDSIVSTLGTVQNQNDTLSSLQVSWSRMAIQSQSLVSDATLLEELLNNQINQLNAINLALILTSIGTFSIFLVVIYVQTFRRTLKSISNLQAGVAVVGSGNLDVKIKENRKDEIGELTIAFNKMTANLKTTTASKVELEQEIEERKKAEEELESNRKNLEKLVEERTKQLKDAERLATIGATAGMVGHDIRNPLQAITCDLYFAKTELAELPNSEQKKLAVESLDEIQSNIDYINKIVADLQDYAKPLNPRAQETNIKALFNEIVTKNGVPKNIKLTVEVEDEAEKIMVDPDYLKRIVSNLTLNAAQAMPNGGILTVRAFADKKTNDILITVKDTGVGIPEGVKPKLFTPMITTKAKGQGFGLAVVKRITEGLGGTVSFESEVDKGTTFIIRLPPPQRAKR